MAFNFLHHPIEMMCNLIIGKTQDAQACAFESLRSFPIPLGIDSVNRAINLYDELCIQAQEIDDEATHRMLPAKSIATQAPIPEPFPENRFR